MFNNRYDKLLMIFCLLGFAYYSFFTKNTHQLTFFGVTLIMLMLQEGKD